MNGLPSTSDPSGVQPGDPGNVGRIAELRKRRDAVLTLIAEAAADDISDLTQALEAANCALIQAIGDAVREGKLGR